MKLFVVVGLGQFGFHTAKEIYAGGGDVLAIDADEKRVAEAKDLVGQAVCMNGADLNALRAVGANKADTAVVALGEEDLEGSILSCTALSDLGVGRIIARAASAMQGRILSRVGATRVVYPEKQMGERNCALYFSVGCLRTSDLVNRSNGCSFYLKRSLPAFH